MQTAAVVLIVLVGLCAAHKSYLIPEDPSIGATSCPGQPNTNVPWTGTPTLVKEVANGSLYTVGEDDDQINGKQRIYTLLCFSIIVGTFAFCKLKHVYRQPYRCSMQGRPYPQKWEGALAPDFILFFI